MRFGSDVSRARFGVALGHKQHSHSIGAALDLTRLSAGKRLTIGSTYSESRVSNIRTFW